MKSDVALPVPEQQGLEQKEHSTPVASSSWMQSKLLYIAVYMAFSSLMLIINKAAVRYWPAATLLLLQLTVSAGAVWCGGKLGYMKVDAVEAVKIKPYILVVVVFFFGIFTNMKALEVSTVETIIVFQTLSSLAVAWGDFKLLKSNRPSAEVVMSLLLIVLGSLLYVITDEHFRVDGYIWVTLYLFGKAYVLYIKHVCDTVPMTSWGRSLYNNLLSVPPALLLVMAWNEQDKLKVLLAEANVSDIFFLLLSCVMGLGISVTGLATRALVSATSFAVIGNMNKVVTVMINCLVWEYHATPVGLLCLSVCLVGGAYYAISSTKKN